MAICKICKSQAINPHLHGRTKGVDLDLCDVCYWRSRAENRAIPDGADCTMEGNGFWVSIKRKDEAQSEISLWVRRNDTGGVILETFKAGHETEEPDTLHWV